MFKWTKTDNPYHRKDKDKMWSIKQQNKWFNRIPRAFKFQINPLLKEGKTSIKAIEIS